MDLKFQYAHHSHEESETVSNVSLSESLQAFDDFDWNGQVEKADKLKKCSPTLSIVYEEIKEFAWVSACRYKGRLQFVSQSHFPGEVNRWFGFSKKMGTVSLYSESFSSDEARKVIELFASKKYESLRILYQKG